MYASIARDCDIPSGWRRYTDKAYVKNPVCPQNCTVICTNTCGAIEYRIYFQNGWYVLNHNGNEWSFYYEGREFSFYM